MMASDDPSEAPRSFPGELLSDMTGFKECNQFEPTVPSNNECRTVRPVGVNLRVIVYPESRLPTHLAAHPPV